MKKFSFPSMTPEILRALSCPNFKKTWLSLGSDWIQIIAVASIAHIFFHPISYIFSIIIIAAKQHALLVLMHSASHWNFFRSRKWNDTVGNILTAWPLFISVNAYREHHLAHHRFTNTEKDPDWGRKIQNPNWQFPKTKSKFFLDFIPYLYGLGLLEMFFAIKILSGNPKNSYYRKEWILRGLFYIAIIASLELSNSLAFLFKYWIIPYLLVLPIFMKIRSIVEHLALPNEHELNASRNITNSPIESFFFGPHHNALHLVHHLYPSVSWHAIPTLQKILQESPDYQKYAHQNTSYFIKSNYPTFNDLVKPTTTKNKEISYDFKASA